MPSMSLRVSLIVLGTTLCVSVPATMGCRSLLTKANPKWTLSINDSNAEIRQKLWERIPFGTSVSQAQKQMEAIGFACTREANTVFWELEHPADPGNYVENIDALICKKFKRTGLLTVYRWTVGLVVVNDAVSDILIRQAADGP